MTSYDYLDTGSTSGVRFKKFLATIMVVALLAAAAVFVYFSLESRSREETLESYSSAIAEGEYEQALDIYRSVREKVLAEDVSNAETISANAVALNEIESDIEQRLKALFERLLSDQEALPEQLAFAEGMAEITGVKLISYAREQLRLFLNGEIDRRQLNTRINDLIQLSNVSPVLGEIPSQIDLMSMAVAPVTEAEDYLSAGKWYEAHSAWTDLAASDVFGAYVSDYAYERLDYTEENMLQPLLRDAESIIDSGRYVTATVELKKMQAVFPDNSQIEKMIRESAPYVPEKTVQWTDFDPVEILTIRPLIINTDTAFDNDQYSMAADDAMITSNEFRAMLDQLYYSDYVLVDADRLYTEDGKYRELTVPEGKKPLVLVIDSLNYYVTRRETGNAWNLILDDAGEVSAQYRNSAGEMIVDREGEAIGILDLFVEEHPKFSYDGAKGVISFTGYECLMGYVVSERQADVRNAALREHGYPEEEWTAEMIAEQRNLAGAVLERLNGSGWLFASSTWANVNLRDVSLDYLREDTDIWLDEIGSLTGPVEILNYPYGAYLNSSDEKHQYLIDNGFRFMTGQGAAPYRIFSENSLYADKLVISGYGLKNPQQSGAGRVFNTDSIIEKTVRP
jgi:hypothetical protein